MMEFADLFNLAVDNKFAAFAITAVAFYIVRFVIKATIVIALVAGFIYLVVLASNDRYDSYKEEGGHHNTEEVLVGEEVENV